MRATPNELVLEMTGCLPGRGPQVDVQEQWAALVRLAREGDRGAFETIVRTHEAMVFRTAHRLLGHLEDARDAAQEVFLRLFVQLHRYDERRALAPWLYRITVNVSRRLHQRSRRGTTTSLDDLIERGKMSHPGTPALQEQAASQSDERRIILAGLETLGRKERAVVVLHDIEGRTTAEVASVLRTTEATVRSHLCRGRVKLAKFRLRVVGGES